MKLQRPRSPHSRARAQLSDKLLAYSAAAAAVTAGAASTARATTFDLSDPSYGGFSSYSGYPSSLPSLSFSADSFVVWESVDFSVGNARFEIGGSHDYYYASPGSHTVYGYLGFHLSSGIEHASLNGVPISNYALMFRSSSGDMLTNAFGSHYGTLAFTTVSAGTGILNLHFGYDGSGYLSLGVVGGTFNDGPTAVPEPSSLAYGLGLVALGFAGIREHRRRRAAAKQPVAN